MENEIGQKAYDKLHGMYEYWIYSIYYNAWKLV